MLLALSRNQSAHLGNTVVSVAPDNSARVFLHGNLIAKRDAGSWSYTLAGWDTPTTRSRLRALGAELFSYKGRRYVGNITREVNASDWF